MTNNYYQNTKKDSEKKHVKDIKILLKKKKKSFSIIVNVIKNFLRDKKRSYLSIKEIII